MSKLKGLRHLGLVIIGIQLFGVACSAPNPPGTPLADGVCEIRSCGASNECAVGDYCDDGCCVEFQAGGCETVECLDIAAQCLTHEDGCECHIINDGGTFNITGTPTLHFEEGQRKTIQAQIALVNGNVLATKGFDLNINRGITSAFTFADDEIQATELAGSATLVASFGELATCEATLMNHGPNSSRNEIRVLAFDQESGQGVADAHVVVEFQESEGDAPTHPRQLTSEVGVASIELEEDEVAQITVFHDKYDYVSVMNVTLTSDEFVRIPLKRREEVNTFGGSTGVLGFDSHIENLSSAPGSIHLGMVSTSFSLSNLENFGTDLFTGGPILGRDCQEEPSNPGCYDLSLPGVTQQHAAVWGGLVVSLPTTEMKPHFEILGKPGRRYVWGMGGTWDIDATAGIFHAISQRTATDECPQCQNPTDTTILRTLLPLMGSSSMGYRSNVLLRPAPLSDWLEHISDNAYEDPRFPHLDSGRNLANLELNAPMGRFTEVRVPTLPKDPLAPDAAAFEGVLVMTGTQTLGAGFIPRGVGLGLDCLSDECIVDGEAVGYDGVVDGIQICPGDSNLACEGRTNYQVGAGNVPLFHQDPTGELVDLPQKTILMALPVDTINVVDFRVRAIVLDGTLTDASINLGNEKFTEAPAILNFPEERKYTIMPTQSTDVHHVTLQSQTNHEAPKWHIYGRNVQQDFVAPSVPGTWADPLDDSNELKVTHATVKLRVGTSYSDLLTSKEHPIHQLLDSARAFSSIAIPR